MARYHLHILSNHNQAEDNHSKDGYIFNTDLRLQGDFEVKETIPFN